MPFIWTKQKSRDNRKIFPREYSNPRPPKDPLRFSSVLHVTTEHESFKIKSLKLKKNNAVLESEDLTSENDICSLSLSYIYSIYIFLAKWNYNHQQGCVRMNQSDRRFISLFSLKANCFSSSLKVETMKNKRIIVEW